MGKQSELGNAYLLSGFVWLTLGDRSGPAARDGYIAAQGGCVKDAMKGGFDARKQGTRGRDNKRTRGVGVRGATD